MTRWLPLVLAAAVLLLTSPAHAATSVHVRVEGIGGDLKRNVLSALTIAGFSKAKQLSDRRIRQAHADAPREIEAALQPFGYYRPHVRATLSKENERWVATYTVDPGPPLAVTTLDVRIDGPGARDPGFRERVDTFPLRTGETLYQPDYERGKQALVDYAAANGFLDADFTAHQIRIDSDRYTSDVVLHLATGPRFRFGPVTLHQDVLDNDLLRGYVTFKEGDPLDTDELLRMQRALSDSPYFSRVEVLTEREQARGLEVPVRVDLVPAARQRWHLGFGYGTDTGPRGTVNYELRRINRRGHRGEGALVVSGIEKSFSTKYIIPGIYPRTDSLSLQLGYADVRPTTSTQQLGIAGATYARAKGRWRQTFALAFQRERYIVGLDHGTADHLVPEADWNMTVADDRLHPLRGLRLEARIRGAVKGALSDNSFGQLYLQGRFIHGLGGTFRLLTRAELGYLATSVFRELPPSQRFFAGGDQSIRGFKYQGVGDLDEAGNVIGGPRLTGLSIELESLFIEKFGRWGAAVFADAGDAADHYSLARRGAGFGLRWLSPIGMVRADLGIAISEPDRPKRFHLTIGPDL